jgi:hypothetical protein
MLSILQAEVCAAEQDAGADRGRFQNQPGLLAAMDADAGAHGGPLNCLLHFHAKSTHNCPMTTDDFVGAGGKGAKHGLFRRVTKRAISSDMALFKLDFYCNRLTLPDCFFTHPVPLVGWAVQ